MLPVLILTHNIQLFSDMVEKQKKVRLKRTFL